MKRIYLSGPMTGIENNNFPAFHEWAARLRADGYEVVSPAEIQEAGTWELCLRADLRELCTCDAIALMPGWERSKGAHLELHVAHRLGLGVMILPVASDQTTDETLRFLQSESAEANGVAHAALGLVADLRHAMGDDGKRMQAELLEYARQLVKDATRYQWLRSRVPGGAYRIIGITYSEGGSGVDAAIDALIAAQTQPPGAPA